MIFDNIQDNLYAIMILLFLILIGLMQIGRSLEKQNRLLRWIGKGGNAKTGNSEP